MRCVPVVGRGDRDNGDGARVLSSLAASGDSEWPSRSRTNRCSSLAISPWNFSTDWRAAARSCSFLSRRASNFNCASVFPSIAGAMATLAIDPFSWRIHWYLSLSLLASAAGAAGSSWFTAMELVSSGEDDDEVDRLNCDFDFLPGAAADGSTTCG